MSTLESLTVSEFIASSPVAVAVVGADGRILQANQAFNALIQHTLSDRPEGHQLLELFTPSLKPEAEALLRKAARGEVGANPQALEFTLPNGSVVTVSMYANTIEWQGTWVLVAQFIDTTDQKNLELKFAHSQKMQAVGQLAGGVAHDFNNLLTAMIGFCDLLLMRHPAGDQSFADIMQIKQNANRAANLVRQLLAFSRRQTLQPKLLDITDVLAELSNLVRRLIGENIELKMVHGRDLKSVKADQGQLEQVIINLAVNARDAMPQGGALTIRTSHATIGPRSPMPRGLVAPSDEDNTLPAGEYVLVEVSDSGTGIRKELLQQIFEPFFSTKEVGSGTGLGLSTVYGIIKQSGGYIFVSSDEGKGTAFHMYFPAQAAIAAQTQESAESTEKAVAQDLTGRSTILLVEDETPVRIFAARALSNKGYTVLEADCGETALEVMEKHGSQVELIITDVIMPGMNGPAMVEKVHEKFPDMKVIFISGYAEDIFVNSYGPDRSFNFLAKPFTLKQLASKVKDVIQGGGKAAA